MAKKLTGVINFIDVNGTKARAFLRDIPEASAPTGAKLLTLATSLYSLVWAGVHSYSLIEAEEVAITGSLVTAVGTNCDKLLILYRWVDIAGLTQYGQMWMPNPDPSKLIAVTGVGYRMTDSDKAALGVLLSAASGVTIDVMEGRPEYKEHDTKDAQYQQTCLRFKDASGKYGVMSFPLCTSKTALETLGAALNSDGYTRSILDRGVFVTETYAECDPTTSPGKPLSDTTTGADPRWNSVCNRAYVKMSYSVANKRYTQRLILPAVKVAGCEKADGQKGWRVTALVGGTVATALTTFFGSVNRTLKFVSSRVDTVNLEGQ